MPPARCGRSTPRIDQFNFAPYNYYQRPDERYGFNAFAHYDVSDHARAYGEFSFNDDHTVAQIAPSGIFFGGTEVFLNERQSAVVPGFQERVRHHRDDGRGRALPAAATRRAEGARTTSAIPRSAVCWV